MNRQSGRFVEVVASPIEGSPEGLYAAVDAESDVPVWVWASPDPTRPRAEVLERLQAAERAWREASGEGCLKSMGVHEQGGRPLWVFTREPQEVPLEGLRRTLLIDEVMQIGEGLARSLRGLHAQRFVHGDVRLGRLLLGLRGARLIPNLDDVLLVDEGRPVHAGETPPELHEGAPATELSDVYGIGVVLAELWPGVTLWPGQTPFARIGAQRSGVLHLDGVSSGVARLVRRLLDPDPLVRPPSAARVHRALWSLRRNPVARPSLGPTWLAPLALSAPWVVWGKDPQRGWQVRFGPPMSRRDSELWVDRMRGRGWDVQRTKQALGRRDVLWVLLGVLVGFSMASGPGGVAGAVFAWLWRSSRVHHGLWRKLPDATVPLPAPRPRAEGGALVAGMCLLGAAAALTWTPWLSVVFAAGFVFSVSQAWRQLEPLSNERALVRRFEGVCGEIRLRMGAGALGLDGELGALGELRVLEREWEAGHREAEAVLGDAEGLLNRLRGV